VYDTAEFADNPEARCSIVLILDVSGSMEGTPIATVNQALGKFRDIIREDLVTALRAAWPRWRRTAVSPSSLSASAEEV
jgi:hypothetical protein